MRKRIGKTVALLLALMMLVTVSVGCNLDAQSGSAQEDSSADESSAAPSSDSTQDVAVETEEGIDPAKYEGLLAWYFPFYHPFGEACKLGAEAYVKDTGVPVEIMIGPELTMQSETENLEVLQSQGYKYFMVFSVDAASSNALYEDFTSKDCVMNNIGWDTAEPTTARTLVSTDIYDSAVRQMEYLVNLLDGKGNIMVVFETVEDAAIQTRRQAVEDTLKKYPDIHVVTELSDMETVEASTMKIQDGLSANAGEIDGIISLGFTCSQALAGVLSDYYESGGEKIHAVTIDADDIINEAVRNEIIDATLVQNSFGIGYIACEVLRLEADGYTPKDGVYQIDTGIIMADKSIIDDTAPQLEAMTKEIISKLTTDYLEKK
jgi:ABC-type sugar transport system substrate-binding protein